MENKAYDRLKAVALVALPALATLYYALGLIWDFPKVEEVVASITAIDTFLGIILGASAKKYKELVNDSEFMGKLVVVQEKFDGSPVTIRIDPKDEIPIFKDGQMTQWLIKREPLK